MFNKMKKYILPHKLLFSLLIVGSIFFPKGYAQLPQGVNYQAVARDGSGNVIANQNIRVQLSILQANPNGSVAYAETHLVTTNTLGLFSLVVGKGTPSFGTFSAINWAANDKYLKVELDPNGGTNYLFMGTTQLLSVPFAFVADSSLKGDHWGNQVVQTNPSLSGKGTNTEPLQIANQGATLGQTLKWNGTTWLPANDDVSGNGEILAVSPRISGNGTSNSPLDISGQNATNGQVLKWNGTAWAPANDQTGTTYTASNPLSINGTNITMVSGTAPGQFLSWNGSTWVPANVTIPTYAAGNGIVVNNNTISSTLWTENGTNIYRNDGLVGIGVMNPQARLDIRSNSLPLSPQLLLFETENDFARLNFSNAQTQFTWGIAARPENSNTQGRLNFFYTNGNQDIMSLTHYGSVGIGTVDPEAAARLQVNTSTKYAGLFLGDFPGDDATVLNVQYDGNGMYDAVAIAGEAEPAYGKGFGAQFYGGNTGSYSLATAGPFNGNYAAIGAYGESLYDQTGFPQPGSTRIGTYGYARGGDFSFGIYGTTNNSGNNNYAGYFEGAVTVIGGLSKSFGTFKIDHPLDPENKYLYHSFVESPDMLNVYNGNITTDASGKAVVELPAYFEALNGDFKYQLTCIGQAANVYVAEEIKNNRFVIQADKPNVKISWQVTGVRIDPVAQTYRVVPEVAKKGVEVGRYLHPEVYGKPASQSLQALFKPAAVQRRPKIHSRTQNADNHSDNTKK